MKASFLAAVLPLCLAAPALAVLSHDVGAPIPEAPPITVNVCEDENHVMINGIVVAPYLLSGPDGVPVYLSPSVVTAGDILFTEVNDNFTVSDMIRIYDGGSGAGNTFSVFSRPSDPADSVFDHPLPAFNTINVNLPEDQIWTDSHFGPIGQWSFLCPEGGPISPEPSTLPLAALATIPFLTRRRKTLRPVPVSSRPF